MIRTRSLVLIIQALFLFSFILGCSSSVGTGEDEIKDEDTHYKIGASVASLPYKDVQSIDIYLKDKLTGKFTKISNGDFISVGIHTIGVKVSSRVIDDMAIDQRVLISDGGIDNQTEAFRDEESGYYVCDYNFTDKYLTLPVLVQVIYPDAMASKEKFVVNTTPGSRPEPDEIVMNGMGISVGKDILAGFDTLLAKMLSGMLGFDVEVKNFTPADNSEGDKEGVLHLELKNLLYGDMVLKDIVKDERGLNIGFEDLSLLWNSNFGEMMGNMVRPVLELSLGSLGFDLSEMLGGLGGDEDDEDSMMSTLLGNLQLEKTLLLNIHGIPDFTTTDFAALGGGLYCADTPDLELDKEGEPLWPLLDVDNSQPEIDMADMINHEDFNINVALTQYNLNQMLSNMMDGFKAIIDASALELPFVTPENPGDPMDIEISVNPGGIAIDFNYKKIPPVALMTANDLRLVFVEKGTPMTELSADITLEMGFGIRNDEEGFMLDITLSPVTELSHIHVLKDNKGLGIFDHAQLIGTIFDALSDSDEGGPMQISLNLNNFGMTPKTFVKESGKIEFDGNGNCFLNLAIDSVDPQALLGEDACFIDTAIF